MLSHPGNRAAVGITGARTAFRLGEQPLGEHAGRDDGVAPDPTGLSRSPASLAEAPRLTEQEIELYSVEEVPRLLQAVSARRNRARWGCRPGVGTSTGRGPGVEMA